MAFNQVQGGLQVEEDSAKRTKIGSARQLSEEEKLERRCAVLPTAMIHTTSSISCAACNDDLLGRQAPITSSSSR